LAYHDLKINIANFKVLLFILCSIGIVSLYSASSNIALLKFSDYKYIFFNQSIRLSIGFVLLIITSFIDYRFYKKNAKWILFFCWTVLLIGYVTSHYADIVTSRGLILFGRNILTTSDLAKFGIIIYLCSFIELNKRKINDIKILLTELAPYLSITLLLIFFQPDMSTTFTISIILLLIIYIAGISTKYIYTFLGLSTFIVISKIIFTPFQRIRFLNWWSGAGDVQSNASVLALSKGGIFGNGLVESEFSKGLLPAVHTDFILPIIGEEFGFIGILFIFILFYLFMFYAIKILQNIPDLFGFFLGMGIIMNVIIYFIINSSYVVGIFPTTGLPLPFISYGGSHLVLTLGSMGIFLNIANSNVNKKMITYKL
tara:strand:- start:866 stop:1978 length:1113 start_codon:yes stop_codon:yes gene_type:complete